MNLRILHQLARSIRESAQVALEAEPVTAKIVETVHWIWDQRHKVVAIVTAYMVRAFSKWIVEKIFGQDFAEASNAPPRWRPDLEVVR